MEKITDEQSLLVSSFNDFNIKFPNKPIEWLFEITADFHNLEPCDVSEALVAQSNCNPETK